MASGAIEDGWSFGFVDTSVRDRKSEFDDEIGDRHTTLVLKERKRSSHQLRRLDRLKDIGLLSPPAATTDVGHCPLVRRATDDAYVPRPAHQRSQRRPPADLELEVATPVEPPDAAELVGIRPSTVKRHLADLRARSGLTTEQLLYGGRAAGSLAVPSLEPR